MKPISVRNQVRLSAARCLYLTLAGMYYRLTRSAITVAIVGLAVAFLAYMLAYSVLAQERTHAAWQELRESRQLGQWVARMSAPDPLPDIVAAVVADRPDRMQEYRRWIGEDSDSTLSLARPAFQRYRAFLDFFAGIRPSDRAVLLGDVDPHQLPDFLLRPDYYPLFTRQLRDLALDVPLGSEEQLRSFLETDWPMVMGTTEAIQTGQQRVVDSIRTAAAGRGLVQWIAVQADSVARLAERQGYSDASRVSRVLQRQAAQATEEEALTRLVASPQVTAHLARLLGVGRKEVDVPRVTRWLRTRSRAEALRGVAAAVSAAPQLPHGAELVAAAARVRRAARLHAAAGADGVPVVRGLAGIPAATRWLVVVSFLVCAVGICNTMFMSVTERFTEIATMKCLGAMDGFVMLTFVFEATIQGIAGSVVGVVTGLALAALRGVAGYGGLLFESVPWGALGTVAGGSVVVGIVLAAGAAVIPAWAAARLAPMEAMRVE